MGLRFSQIPPFYTVLGLMFVAGVILIFQGQDLRAEMTAMQNIPRLEAAALNDSSVDRQVFVEGLISPDTPKAHQALVAYIHEQGREKRIYITHTPSPQEGRSPRDTTIEPSYRVEIEWETVNSVLPPLLITTDTGVVQVEAPGGGNGYTLRNVSVRIEDGLQRYRGLQASDQAVALGTIKASNAGNYLDAQIVARGTHAQFVQAGQQNAQQMFWTGIALVVVSTLVVAGRFLWNAVAAGVKRERVARGREEE
jgi:hypothetical protein